jgi:gliding motility-associated-like protein
MLFNKASAYHIAGGDFTLQWISGNDFQLRLILYRDCSNPQAAQFDQTIIVGLFDKFTDAAVDTFHMQLGVVDSLQLTGSGCSPPPSVCMQSGTYTRTVTIPNNPNGYYLIWERCCRNTSIVNIVQPDKEGLAFYQEVPDPALHNSTPIFNSAPLPYTCVGQLFRFSFNATDVDGDSLVYELSDPLSGGNTSNQSPNPFSFGGNGGNQSPVAGPYASTTWTPGFSLSNVLGSTQPLVINSSTGIVEGVPSAVGLYALAVNVYEYKNGILIGLVRREIEFTSIACTGNIAPNVSPNILNQSYTLNASDTLCFNIHVDDQNGDSLFLKYSGEIFQNSAQLDITAPYAQSADTTGLDSLTTFFCWETGCNQSRDSAYNVVYEVSDNGCPLPLIVQAKIKILVNPAPLMPSPKLLCINLNDSNTIVITKSEAVGLDKKYFRDYILYRSVNGKTYRPLQTIKNPDQLIFTDSTAFNANDSLYCYYLTANNRCDISSLSIDTLCSSQAKNINKNYITSVSVDSKNLIHLKWEKFPNNEYVTYKISRKTNDSLAVFQEIATLTNTSILDYLDEDVETGIYSYCYIITNQNVCAQISDESYPACSILLKGKESLFSNDLNWSTYINWKGAVENYIAERSLLNRALPYKEQIILNGGDSAAVDDQLDLTGGIFGYRIRAKEGSGGIGESLSNEIELKQPPFAYIPSAFSPNEDNKNDTWGVATSFVKDFKLTLYNRWGQLIFEANSVNDRWNGMYNNIPVEEGVYFYKMRFKGYDVYQEYERTGSVTVIR